MLEMNKLNYNKDKWQIEQHSLKNLSNNQNHYIDPKEIVAMDQVSEDEFLVIYKHNPFMFKRLKMICPYSRLDRLAPITYKVVFTLPPIVSFDIINDDYILFHGKVRAYMYSIKENKIVEKSNKVLKLFDSIEVTDNITPDNHKLLFCHKIIPNGHVNEHIIAYVDSETFDIYGRVYSTYDQLYVYPISVSNLSTYINNMEKLIKQKNKMLNDSKTSNFMHASNHLLD